MTTSALIELYRLQGHHADVTMGSQTLLDCEIVEAKRVWLRHGGKDIFPDAQAITDIHEPAAA